MKINLPTERSVVTNYNPRFLVLYGRPKCGKSTLMASLDDNLIIDLEDGYRSLSVMAVQARSANDLFAIREAIIEKGRELKKMPYKYITIDNATRLEEIALSYAAQLYRNTPMGTTWGIMKDEKGNLVKDKAGKYIPDPKADIRSLPQGGGYLYLRQAVKKLVDMFKSPICESLILVAHVKEKQIKKDSEEMSEMAVDLAGKLGDIICGEADAIGLIYRSGNKTFISFEGGDNTLKEARPLHLRGKKILVATSDESNEVTVDMSKIFLNDTGGDNSDNKQ